MLVKTPLLFVVYIRAFMVGNSDNANEDDADDTFWFMRFQRCVQPNSECFFQLEKFHSGREKGMFRSGVHSKINRFVSIHTCSVFTHIEYNVLRTRSIRTRFNPFSLLIILFYFTLLCWWTKWTRKIYSLPFTFHTNWFTNYYYCLTPSISRLILHALSLISMCSSLKYELARFSLGSTHRGFTYFQYLLGCNMHREFTWNSIFTEMLISHRKWKITKNPFHLRFSIKNGSDFS